MIYRIRQAKKIDFSGLWDALSAIGINLQEGFGSWLYKLTYNGKRIDMFDPEESYSENEQPYPEDTQGEDISGISED